MQHEEPRQLCLRYKTTASTHQLCQDKTTASTTQQKNEIYILLLIIFFITPEGSNIILSCIPKFCKLVTQDSPECFPWSDLGWEVITFATKNGWYVYRDRSTVLKLSEVDLEFFLLSAVVSEEMQCGRYRSDPAVPDRSIEQVKGSLAFVYSSSHRFLHVCCG